MCVCRRVSYSKSVSAFRSARGWKVSALFLMPSTQAESGVLAKMRPKQRREFHKEPEIAEVKMLVFFLGVDRVNIIRNEDIRVIEMKSDGDGFGLRRDSEYISMKMPWLEVAGRTPVRRAKRRSRM